MKVGDKLIRLLGGQIPMPVIVGEVNEDTFKVGSEDGTVPWQDGWTFCKKTGAEIDDDLNWGPKYGKTGSFIKLNE